MAQSNLATWEPRRHQERSLVAHARVLAQAVALRLHPELAFSKQIRSQLWTRGDYSGLHLLSIRPDGVMALNSFLELPVWTQPRTEGSEGRKEDRIGSSIHRTQSDIVLNYRQF